jgi:hypothetical protein
MKHIKRFKIFEMAMGVPEGLTELATLAYGRLLSISDRDINELTNDYDHLTILQLEGDFRINEFEFDTITINVTLSESEKLYDEGEGPKLAGMSFRDRAEHIKKENGKKETEYFLISITDNQIRIGIDIIVPFYDMETKDIRDFIESKKIQMTSSLGHELKHAYDSFVVPVRPLSSRTEYAAFNKVCFGIKAIDSFFYHLYFTSMVENLVRPSELASAIKAGDIDKENFLDFLEDNRTYKELEEIKSYVPELKEKLLKGEELTSKEIGEFGYEKMKRDLLKDVDLIRKRLDDSDIDYPNSDEEVVDLILKLAYRNLHSEKSEIISRYVMDLMDEDDLFRQIFTGVDVESDYMDRYIKKISYDNHKDFFENEIKKFIFVAYKLSKQLSKLYDMAKDVNVNPLHAKITKRGQVKRNESILDWELWQEVNGIKPNIKNIK